MPMVAILLGLLGLIPFIVCGLAALGSDATLAARMLTALISYAAVALAFVSGISWGLDLQSAQADAPAQRSSLGLGVLPPLIGWIALLLPMAVGSWVALLVLIAGYIGSALIEQRSARRELTPSRHVWLRWGFTGVAVAMLTTVLTLRALGRTINF